MTANLLTTDEARDVEHIDLITENLVAGLVGDDRVFALEGGPTHSLATLVDADDVSGTDTFTIEPERFATENGPATMIEIGDEFVEVTHV